MTSYSQKMAAFHPFIFYNWVVAWHFQQFGLCDQQRIRPACSYAQTDQSLSWSLKYSMTVKLLTEPHLRFLSLKEGYTCSPESTLVKIPHCRKSHVTAHILENICNFLIFHLILNWFVADCIVWQGFAFSDSHGFMIAFPHW